MGKISFGAVALAAMLWIGWSLHKVAYTLGIANAPMTYFAEEMEFFKRTEHEQKRRAEMHRERLMLEEDIERLKQERAALLNPVQP